LHVRFSDFSFFRYASEKFPGTFLENFLEFSSMIDVQSSSRSSDAIKKSPAKKVNFSKKCTFYILPGDLGTEKPQIF